MPELAVKTRMAPSSSSTTIERNEPPFFLLAGEFQKFFKQ